MPTPIQKLTCGAPVRDPPQLTCPMDGAPSHVYKSTTATRAVHGFFPEYLTELTGFRAEGRRSGAGAAGICPGVWKYLMRGRSAEGPAFGG
ncbi:protein of unknown function [Kyrpidia spormannii]|uniref:Uncharacterized protein n=2 Tax=Kyrpidia spormannii TaxID=2055160 RepID=A0ACA8Z8P9_9BACL|nr:protein of unknown function [Kyrpidia spormannii]CAB3391709.1 protein of unknown function [Kyrpidia spormannii]